MTVAVREGWRLVRIERRAAAEDLIALDQLAQPDRELETRARAPEALQMLAGLLPTERRLLALRAAGYSYREIQAIELRSYTEVNPHLTRWRARLRARERGEN